MRRIISLTIAVLFILSLASCGGAGSAEALEDIRAGLRDAAGLRFAAGIRADYGERIFDLSVEYESSGEAGTLTVTAPELIAGAQVRYAGNASSLAVGEVEIYTGEILPGGLSPVDAVPVMVDAWKNGLVTETVRETYREESCIAALFRIDDLTNLRTWFAEDSGLPARAEFTFDGHTVVTVEFYDMEAE